MTPYNPNIPPSTAPGLAAELRRLAVILAEVKRELEALDARLVAIGA